MLHEFYPAGGKGGGVFERPDAVFGLLQDGTAVLDDEVEVGVEMRELDIEAACLRR